MSNPSDDAPEASVAEPARFGEVPILLFVRGLALVTVLMSLIVGFHVYLGFRLIRDAQVPEPFATVAWATLWVAFASIFGGFIGGRLLPKRFAGILQWVGFGWMGAFGLLLVGTAASDVVLWVASKLTAVDASWLSWRAIAVVALTAPALAYGFWVARRPEIKRVTIDIPGLGAGLDGTRIVQISDVHIGETLGKDFAQLVADTVNSLKPDLVAVTGDMIDGSVARLRDQVAPLGTMKAKHGVFFVTGNHEYYSGGAAWEAEARNLGMTVLHNEHRVIENAGATLIIGGVTDLEGARFSESHTPRVDLAFVGSPTGAPRVLLAHQPRFSKAAAAQKVSLMLSGHTHGGQIFPFMFLVKLQQPVIGGFALLSGVPTYTSNGTGYWGPPFRIGPRGEVTEITLRAVPG